MKKLLLLSIMCLCLSNCAVGNWYMSELEKHNPSKRQLEQIKIEAPEYHDMVKNGEFSIGMPEKYFRMSVGKPIRINETCNNSGCVKQYVLYSDYVYIREGKVSSWASKDNSWANWATR